MKRIIITHCSEVVQEIIKKMGNDLYPISYTDYLDGEPSGDEEWARFQLDFAALRSIVENECAPVIVLGYGLERIPLDAIGTAQNLLGWYEDIKAVMTFTIRKVGDHFDVAIFRFSRNGISLMENCTTVSDTDVFDLLIKHARLVWCE
jgi:hypothetical protein